MLVVVDLNVTIPGICKTSDQNFKRQCQNNSSKTLRDVGMFARKSFFWRIEKREGESNCYFEKDNLKNFMRLGNNFFENVEFENKS